MESLVIVPEIPSLPGLDKVGPGYGIEDIHRRSLSLIVVALGALAQIGTGRFTRALGKGSGQYSPFGGIVVLPGYFYIVIGHGRIDKIPLELFPRRSRPDHRCRQILRILHHQLGDTILVAGKRIGNGYDNGFVADAREFDHISFEHNEREHALLAGIGPLVTSFDDDAHHWDRF